jgi:hypothetical protein
MTFIDLKISINSFKKFKSYGGCFQSSFTFSSILKSLRDTISLSFDKFFITKTLEQLFWVYIFIFIFNNGKIWLVIKFLIFFQKVVSCVLIDFLFAMARRIGKKLSEKLICHDTQWTL